ncbi:motility-associated protein [Demequina litorisediminis]|uniref:motility-associated protein n=1 Tax=Demequina litorisediminis TaxID=1849022 RepID=UPI0032AFC901
MDFATPIGIVLALGAVLTAIILEGSSPMSVMLPAPMMLVIGGTIGAGLATTMLPDFLRAFRALPGYLAFKRPDTTATVEPARVADRPCPPRGPACARGRRSRHRRPIPA